MGWTASLSRNLRSSPTKYKETKSRRKQVRIQRSIRKGQKTPASEAGRAKVKMEEEREMKRTRRGREKTLQHRQQQHRQQQHRQQQHRQQHPRQQKAKSNRALKRLRKTRTKVPTNRNKNNSSRERPTGRASR